VKFVHLLGFIAKKWRYTSTITWALNERNFTYFYITVIHKRLYQ